MLHNFPFNNTLPETELAVRAVKEAGDAVMKIYRHDFTTTFKKDNEPLTEADLKSNNIIQKILVILDSLDRKSGLSHLLISSPSRTSKSGKCSRNFLAIVDFPEQGRPVIQIIKLIKIC